MLTLPEIPRIGNKTKLVLEVIEGEKTINKIASAYEIIPNN